MTKTKFFKKKSLISVKIQNKFFSYPLNFVKPIKYKFLLNVFMKNCSKAALNIFFYYLLNKNSLKFLNFNEFLFSKNNFLFVMFKYNNFLLFNNWVVFNFYYIPTVFWFNMKFLIKKKKILYFFFSNFKISYFNSQNKVNFSLFLSKISFINFFFKKINYFIENSTFFLEILNFSTIQKNNLNLFISSFFTKNSINLIKFYNNYRAFLNTHLYLSWDTLFNYSIATTGFDFTLLKNFNLTFFWNGDLKQSVFFYEFFLWTDRNVIYRKGHPYTTFKFGNNKNNFVPFYSFYSTELLSNSKLKKIPTFFNNLYLIK